MRGFLVTVGKAADNQLSFVSLSLQVRVGEVYVNNGDFSSYTLFATYVGPYTKTQGRLSCARGYGVRGRFVSIKKVKAENGTAPLQIIDVNVFVSKGK